jgi:antitoxin HicB
MTDPSRVEGPPSSAGIGAAAARYTIEVRENEDGSFFARIPDLPGCMTEAETASDVLAQIEDAKRAWIATALEDGLEVPPPRDTDDYSGRFVVRVPRSLHADLVRAARREGVSLNTLVVGALSRFLGSP